MGNYRRPSYMMEIPRKKIAKIGNATEDWQNSPVTAKYEDYENELRAILTEIDGGKP